MQEQKAASKKQRRNVPGAAERANCPYQVEPEIKKILYVVPNDVS
jgi:hypothetical protein